MPDPLITLTTDFGQASPYVAAMKGVIVTICPAARIIDLSHEVPPQDLRHAAFLLSCAIPWFPPYALHIVVVDPGVGTERKLIYAELGEHRLLAPDNGVLTMLARSHPMKRAIELSEHRHWLPEVSSTFHGRDILAPVAAHLALGLDPNQLGPTMTTIQVLDIPKPRRHGDHIDGEVIFVDHFGNLMTNIATSDLPSGRRLTVIVDGHVIDRHVRTYGEARRGELVSLSSSSGYLEIAEVQGNAARTLGVSRGAPVQVEWSGSKRTA